jgi:hypothetical protein
MRLALLLVATALGTTACLGGRSTAPTSHGGDATANGVVPAGSLRLTVRFVPGKCALGVLTPACKEATPEVRHYTLTCGPAGGSMLDPARACAAIADYLGRRNQLGGCLGVDRGAGSTADLTGTFGHRPFSLKLETAYSWCGQPRPILRDFWILSTLPCSADNGVLREHGSDLAMAIGCVAHG